MKTGAELELAFKAIPTSVTTLNLSGNDLYNKTGAELELAFKAIPTSVTTLDLGWNHFGDTTVAELKLAFEAIPTSVTTLDLRMNYLDLKAVAELAQAFAAIPVSVTTLDLSSNFLNRKTQAELAKAFAAIPVTVGYLENNDIPMAVFESFEHPISWMAKAKRLLELDRTSIEVSEHRTDALNLLLKIPPKSPLYREAAQLLRMDLHGVYVSQQASNTMPFSADAGVVSEAPTTFKADMQRSGNIECGPGYGF
jgi:hypothetical protein